MVNSHFCNDAISAETPLTATSVPGHAVPRVDSVGVRGGLSQERDDVGVSRCGRLSPVALAQALAIARGVPSGGARPRARLEAIPQGRVCRP